MLKFGTEEYVTGLCWMYSVSIYSMHMHTVKPFNLAALKVGKFACKFVLAPLNLVNCTVLTLK